MHVVRYQPADAIQWIETALSSPATSLDFKTHSTKSIRETILAAFEKLLDVGKEATATALLRSIRAIEYRLYEDHLEVDGLTGTKRYPYADLETVEVTRGGCFTFRGKAARLRIRPYASLVLSGVRLPLGWLRDGIPVPYSLLAEEIALRSSCSVVSGRHGEHKPEAS